MVNALVTGGAGFIGSNLVNELVSRDYNVTIIDNLSTGKKENLNPKSNFYQLDICTDLSKIFEKQNFDVVFHLAAQMNVRRSIAEPFFDSHINIGGTVNILENSRKFGVKQVIFSSSGGAVYGDTNNIPTEEDHPLLPLSPYGVSKVAGEYYMSLYQRLYKLKCTSLRYANVYGPRQNPEGEAGVVSIFIDKMLKEETPVINGDGSKTRDFIFVEDVVMANIAAMSNTQYDYFNIGTSKETSIKKIYEELAEIMAFNENALFGPDMEGEQKRSCISYKKAERVLNWKPKIKLRDGLEKTIKFINNQK